MTPVRVLVTDRDSRLRRAVRRTLGSNGYKVGEARSGEQALGRLQEEEYDLMPANPKYLLTEP